MQTVQVILDGLANILKMAAPDVELITTAIEEAGALEMLEKLQAHSNADIYRLAYTIIENYFNPDTNVSERTIVLDEHTHMHTRTHTQEESD